MEGERLLPKIPDLTYHMHTDGHSGSTNSIIPPAANAMMEEKALLLLAAKNPTSSKAPREFLLIELMLPGLRGRGVRILHMETELRRNGETHPAIIDRALSCLTKFRFFLFFFRAAVDASLSSRSFRRACCQPPPPSASSVYSVSQTDSQVSHTCPAAQGRRDKKHVGLWHQRPVIWP
jgi:hypothetical protein